jgi:hypothetical protein
MEDLSYLSLRIKTAENRFWKKAEEVLGVLNYDTSILDEISAERESPSKEGKELNHEFLNLTWNITWIVYDELEYVESYLKNTDTAKNAKKALAPVFKKINKLCEALRFILITYQREDIQETNYADWTSWYLNPNGLQWIFWAKYKWIDALSKGM